MKRTFDFKIACIGAGPSNLSVAAALEDQAPWLAAQTIILERDEKIAWQPGQLIEGTLSQVHHCKDLATLRDPTSRFTFLNYLKTEGRLDDFINMGRNTPYRFEVSDYHAWAAYQLRHVDLRLGNGVRRVVPIRSKQGICGWEIETETGERITSRHLICSVGRALNVPEPLRRLGSDRVVHCANYLPAIESWSHPDPQKIAIIGASQSSAEVAIDCGARFPDAKRVLIMRSIGMASYESSKHTNELFFPGYVDKFNGLEAKDRRSVINQMHRANYGGLAPHTCESLYEERYLARAGQRSGIDFRPLTEIDAAEKDLNGLVNLSLHSKYNGRSRECFDLVLLGTGFDNAPPPLLRELAKRVGLAEVSVNRDHQLDLGPGDHEAQCYVLGTNEATHGIADTLLSVQAARAGEVVEELITQVVPSSGQHAGSIKRFSETNLAFENGLWAQRLLPLPLSTPFEASWCVIRSGEASVAHTHHEAEIFVAIDGEAIVQIDGEEHTFKKGDTAFFEPGVAHRVVNNGSRDFVMYSIWWDDEMCSRQIGWTPEKLRSAA